MLIHADHDKLLELAKSFYDVSHTMISIYDANKKLICSYPAKMCQFCNELRKSSTLNARCIKCDDTALEKCDETRTVYSYKCHMGLMEVAVPIIQYDMIIGYILFGQITDERDKSKLLTGLDNIAQKHGLDLAILEDGVQKIKYRSPQYITSISKLTEMCASYIWQNSFISIKNGTTAHALDIYIRENLCADLSVSVLCHKFNTCRSTLYSISKEHFGCGITDYVTRCRISLAKKLLREKHAVYEVAEMVGIPDTNYFIRLFKKHTGTTPKKY